MAKVIAEFCQNHKGDRKIMKDMIWAAKEAGADYAKIQSIHSKYLNKRERFETGIIENGVVKAIKRPYKNEYERLKPMDLEEDDFIWFGEECGKAGIEPMTTVFTRGVVPFISSLGWKSVKIASYDCASHPLIRDARDKFEHIYISTGASFDDEIINTAEIFTAKNYSFLQCVTIYPTPLYELHLRRMFWLRQFADSVGFSDHSLVARDGNKACAIALWLGANVVERHFTILATDETKDGPVSVNTEQLADICVMARSSKEDLEKRVLKEIPAWALALGQENRELSRTELLNRDYYRGRFADFVNGEPKYNWEE